MSITPNITFEQFNQHILNCRSSDKYTRETSTNFLMQLSKTSIDLYLRMMLAMYRKVNDEAV